MKRPILSVVVPPRLVRGKHDQTRTCLLGGNDNIIGNADSAGCIPGQVAPRAGCSIIPPDF